MILILILLFIQYILASMQASFVFGGDSAEYSLTGSTFSIPHAPGYPLYTLLSNLLVRIIPLGTITWKIGLLSSIPTVLTSYFIYKIIIQLIKDKFVALFSSVFYIFIFVIWLYSIVPEAFALNSLLIASITYLCLRLNQTAKNRNRIIYLICLLIGLSVAHHHTFVLFIPGWFLLLKTNSRNFFLKNKVKNLFFLLLGASFYLYAPVASYFNPPLDWENPQTLDGFIRLITRSSYGTFSAFPGAQSNLPQQLLTMFSSLIFLLQDFKVLGLILIIIGIVTLFKINKNFFKFIVCTLIMQFFFLFIIKFALTHPFLAGVYERFLTLIYLALIFPFAIGVWKVIEVFKNTQKLVNSAQLKKVLQYSIYVFFLIYLGIMIQQNYLRISKIKNLKAFETFAKDLLKTAPQNSIVNILSDTAFFSSMYVYHVEKYRDDLKLIFIDLIGRDYMRKKIIQQYPDVYIPKSNDKKIFESFLQKNSKKYTILWEKPLSTGYWLPYGLLWKYYPTQKDALKDTENVLKVTADLWQNKYSVPILDRYDKDIFHLVAVQDYYMEMYYAHALTLAVNKRYDEAVKILDEIRFKYKSNIKGINVAFLEISLNRENCTDGKKYADAVDTKQDLQKSIDVKILLKYYSQCDQKNKNIEKYIKLYNKLKTDEDVSLKKL